MPRQVGLASNPIYRQLAEMGIIKPDKVVEFFPRVRDADNICVYRCEDTEVIFLSQVDQANVDNYQCRDDLSYWESENRDSALLKSSEDDRRRAQQFEKLIIDRSWIDVGTGLGGLLDCLAPIAGSISAIEPHGACREMLSGLGYRVYPTAEDVDSTFDIMTLFHSFEHFENPLQELKTLKKKIMRGGKIVIEVPHARDALITLYESESFKKFTFWSEHIILHTRESLKSYLQAADFGGIEISGFQRYNLANHLHWLSKGNPGGHVEWEFLAGNVLDEAYENSLVRIDKTDTLIAIATA